MWHQWRQCFYLVLLTHSSLEPLCHHVRSLRPLCYEKAQPQWGATGVFQLTASAEIPADVTSPIKRESPLCEPHEYASWWSLSVTASHPHLEVLPAELVDKWADTSHPCCHFQSLDPQVIIRSHRSLGLFITQLEITITDTINVIPLLNVYHNILRLLLQYLICQWSSL